MNKSIFFKKTFLAATVGVMLGLTGCSDSSSSSSPSTFSTGVFLDAPVKGLAYSSICDGAPSGGVTNEAGEFKYKDGCDVTFKMAGIDIGTLPGAGIVPVTSLPKGIQVAQLLQSFDTHAEAEGERELIDISKMTIPPATLALIQTAFSALDPSAAQEVVDIALADVFEKIEDSAEFEDGAERVFTVLVSESDATQHIKETLAAAAIAWTPADIEGQVFIVPEDDNINAFIFNANGTGTQYETMDGANFSSKSIAWSLSTGGVLTVGDTEVRLLKKEDNKYVVATNSEVNGLETYHVDTPKLLDIKDIDGKVFTLSDVSDECIESTLKVDGNQLFFVDDWTGCANSEGVIDTDEYTVSNDSEFDNVLKLEGNDGSVIKVAIIDGDLTEGRLVVIESDFLSTMKFKEKTLEESSDDSEAYSIANSDLINQVYVVIEEGLVLAFSETESIEFNDGDSDGVPYSEMFAWHIQDNRVHISYNNGEKVQVAISHLENNKYTVEGTDPDGGDISETLYKALPITVAVLDGKILAMDTSNDTDCDGRTIKFANGSAKIAEKCGADDVTETDLTVTADAAFDNVINISGQDSDGAFSLKIVLLKGDLTAGTFGLVEFDANSEISDVFTEDFTLSDCHWMTMTASDGTKMSHCM